MWYLPKTLFLYLYELDKDHAVFQEPFIQVLLREFSCCCKLAYATGKPNFLENTEAKKYP